MGEDKHHEQSQGYALRTDLKAATSETLWQWYAPCVPKKTQSPRSMLPRLSRFIDGYVFEPRWNWTGHAARPVE
jgi:hypothetical protein